MYASHVYGCMCPNCEPAYLGAFDPNIITSIVEAGVTLVGTGLGFHQQAQAAKQAEKERAYQLKLEQERTKQLEKQAKIQAAMPQAANNLPWILGFSAVVLAGAGGLYAYSRRKA